MFFKLPKIRKLTAPKIIRQPTLDKSPGASSKNSQTHIGFNTGSIMGSSTVSSADSLLLAFAYNA